MCDVECSAVLWTGASRLDSRLTVAWLCQVSNSSSSTKYTYDDLGRIVTSKQVTDTPEYSFSYEYNLADGLTKLTYPSGREVLTTYAQNGRPLQVQGRPTPSSSLVSYASNAVYWAHGAAARMDMEAGTKKQEWCFNVRLQMVGMRVGTGASAQPNCAYVSGSDQIHLSYGYDSGNNGNVQSQTISPLGATQNYTYDNVNRLTQMQEGANVENYGYDRWGNRWVSSREGTLAALPTGVPIEEGSYLINNRMGPVSACSPTADYDCAGNLRSVLGTTANYDGENLVKSAVKGGTTVVYAYDGDGRRVKSTVGAVSTVFVYNAFGELAAEYGNTPAEGRKYVYTDALGSTRLETCSGCAQTLKRFDYLPFGEEMSTSSRTTGLGYGLSGGDRVKFTGKERDAETGLDYFGARYLSAAQGRFTSPDAPLLDQDPQHPQSWNLYAYVRNNPLIFTDPTGNACVSNGSGGWKDDDSGGQTCAQVDADNARGVRNEANPNNPAVQGNTVSHSLLMGALIEGMQRAEGPVNAAAVGTVVVMSGALAGWAYGGLAGGEMGALGLEMLPSQARNIQAIENAIANHVRMTDLAGAVKETAGFTIRTGSKVWNHRLELIETARNLRGSVRALKGSLNDPTHGATTRQLVQQAIQKAESALRQIDAALRR